MKNERNLDPPMCQQITGRVQEIPLVLSWHGFVTERKKSHDKNITSKSKDEIHGHSDNYRSQLFDSLTRT